MSDHDRFDSRRQDRVDLSALDPMGEPERWRAVVGETMRRVDAVLDERLTRQRDAFALIASWARPLLAAAAILTALLIPLEFALHARETAEAQARRLAALSAGWSPGEQAPSAEQFFRALGWEAPR